MHKNLEITLEQGTLKGKEHRGWGGVTYYSYQGIPYATPPLGALRFKAPVPPTPWFGILDATKEGNRSAARSFSGRMLGSEDCLYLNVYTRKISNNSPKPVIVWIHGGGWKSGSGGTDLHGPDYLISEDIILVTINYRLGILGFLRVEDPSLDVPGNAALKDMVMALQWVQKNISKFGGDPNNVTIMGESAGAAAVHLISVSPMAKGLFHKIIAQSGTALSPFALNKHPRSVIKWAQEIGSNASTEVEALEFLCNATAEQLVDAETKITALKDKLSFRVVGPVIEYGNTSTNNFLPIEPAELVRNSVNYPMILGYNSSEGSIYTTKGFRNDLVPMDFQLEDPVPADLQLEKGSDLSKQVGAMIRRHYYGDKTPSYADQEIYNKMQTNMNFGLMVKKTVDILRKQQSKERAFIYYFTYDSPSNLYKKFAGTKLAGAAHGDELTYLFKTTFPVEFQPNDFKLIRKMCKMWANFATCGQPVPDCNDFMLPVDWKPIGKNYGYLEIDEEFEFVENEMPNQKEMEFWDDLYRFVEDEKQKHKL